MINIQTLLRNITLCSCSQLAKKIDLQNKQGKTIKRTRSEVIYKEGKERKRPTDNNKITEYIDNQTNKHRQKNGQTGEGEQICDMTYKHL